MAAQDQKASASVGRAGEHLALAHLSLAGYICTLCQIKDHDAYIQTDTRTLTLQVKTASKANGNSQSYKFYTPKRGEDVSDVFAFVAINLNAVVFRRGDELSTVTTYVSTEEFMNEKMSMQKTFDSLR